MFRKTVTLFTLLLAVLALSACFPMMFNAAKAEATVSQTFTATAPRVVVEMFNGGIDVTAGEGDTVKVDVVKHGSGASQADADADLNNVQVNITQQGDTIRVTAQRADQNPLINSGASATLRVPAGSTLDLRTSNGLITTAGPLAGVKAQTSNGLLTVRGAQGPIDLNTSNGAIIVDGGQGAVNADTSNGAITISALAAVVNAHTSNGAIRFSGSLASGRHTLNSSNGSIVVTLPAEAAFQVDASTSNGNIHSDFAVADTDQSDKRLVGTVGNDPGAALEVRTSNANIDLQASRE